VNFIQAGLALVFRESIGSLLATAKKLAEVLVDMGKKLAARWSVMVPL
jgi:hypothetical protein